MYKLMWLCAFKKKKLNISSCVKEVWNKNIQQNESNYANMTFTRNNLVVRWVFMYIYKKEEDVV